jgi:Right handed beta helix region
VSDRTALRRVPQDVTSGPGWTWDTRGWLQVTDDGAVVERLEVSGPIDATGKNVTVRDNVILVSGETWGVALRHTTNATISANTIGAAGTTPRLLVGIKDIYGDAVGATVTANDIAGTSTGIQMGSGLIRDNYIHDLAMVSGDHVNGITSNGSSQRLVIEHNTVLNHFNQTDAIGLFQDFGVEADRLITGNLLAGGGYTIYGGDGPFGRTHDIRIVGNRISRLYFPSGGSYGPLAYFDDSGDGNTWMGNVWDEDASPVA